MKTNDTLYNQIYTQLMREINEGLYDGGKQLPTEMELAKKYYVSRITIKKAMGKLAERGVITRIPGRGSFVRKDFAMPSAQLKPDRNGRLIALVMGGYGSSYGLDVLAGAMDHAQALGYHLIVKTTNNRQKLETETISQLMDSGISGIIIQPAHGEMYNEILVHAVYSKYPIVMIDRFMPGIDVPFVGIDNKALSKAAVGALKDRGHENIALLALEDDLSSSLKERMQGYIDAYMDRNSVVRRELWLLNMGDDAKRQNIQSGTIASHGIFVDAVAKHLQAHPEITALFCTEYAAAKAARDAARRVGRQVPDDLSIVSFDFDNNHLGLNQMSHIKQPQFEIGECAVHVLHNILTGTAPVNHSHLLEGIWVEGDSIAPPASHHSTIQAV